jgi:adenylate cyclase
MRRAATPRSARRGLDARERALYEPAGVVFTDTADFTRRVRRHGVLHFLMAFSTALPALDRAARAAGGRLLKVEGDSLLLRFPDATRACRGVLEMDAALRRHNRGRPADERLRFSYGVGFGELIVLEADVFGLEVNLASKLGEDVARPGEALLTPAAAAALDAATRSRLLPHGLVDLAGRPLAVARLPLPRAARTRRRSRSSVG